MFNPLKRWRPPHATLKPVSDRPAVGPVRKVEGAGWRVELDLAPQVLSLEIPEEITWHADEEPLLPTCPQGQTPFVSASMLAVNAKLFDDGLYAAAELALQEAKVPLLTALADTSASIAAAARLGGLDILETPESHRIIAGFLGDQRLSKPIGFYTWSDPLHRIFQQDRLPQQELSPEDAVAVRAVLQGRADIRASYRQHLESIARLTNPFPEEMKHVLDGGGSLFPASRSFEGDLVKRLFTGRPVPRQFFIGGRAHRSAARWQADS
jgi:hypothetical protein